MLEGLVSAILHSQNPPFFLTSATNTCMLRQGHVLMFLHSLYSSWAKQGLHGPCKGNGIQHREIPCVYLCKKSKHCLCIWQLRVVKRGLLGSRQSSLQLRIWAAVCFRQSPTIVNSLMTSFLFFPSRNMILEPTSVTGPCSRLRGVLCGRVFGFFCGNVGIFYIIHGAFWSMNPSSCT